MHLRGVVGRNQSCPWVGACNIGARGLFCEASGAELSQGVAWQVDTEVSDSVSESSEFGPCFGTYCLNCSERRHGTVCERCGHDSLSCPLDLTPEPIFAWSHADVDQDVAIVYDDRMMLHDKGDGRPHPERPDRLRAIMARLMKSGLAGRLLYPFFFPL